MSEPSPSKRRRLPRFSLRSLLFFVLMLASAFALWLHWDPWVPLSRVDLDPSEFDHIGFMADGERVVLMNSKGIRIWNINGKNPPASLEGHQTNIMANAMTVHGPVQATSSADSLRPILLVPGMEPPEVQAMKERLGFTVRLAFENLTFLRVLRRLEGLLGEKGIHDVRIDLAPSVQVSHLDKHVSLHSDSSTWREVLENSANIADLACLYEEKRILIDTISLRNKTIADQRRLENDEAVHLWHMESGELVHKLGGLGGTVRSLRFLSGGKFLAVALESEKVFIFDTATWDEKFAFDLPTGAEGVSVKLSGDGRRMALTGGYGKGTSVKEADAKADIAEFPDEGVAIQAIALSADGERLATLNNEGRVWLYDIEKGEAIWTWRLLTAGDTLSSCSLYFTPDSKHLLSSVNNTKEVRSGLTGRGERLHMDPDHQWSFASDGCRAAGTYGDMYRVVVDLNCPGKLWKLPRWSADPDTQKVRGILGLPVEDQDSAPYLSIDGIGNPFAPGPPLVVGPTDSPGFVRFSLDGERLVANIGAEALGVWQRRRPEWWWGVAWLPEFWLTLAFAAGLVWSLWRDRKAIAGR